MKLRRKIKNDFLEKCQEMKKVFYEVNRLLTISDDAELFEILASCQQTAIELGTSIERLDTCHGQDKAVALIEQLCEIIYQLNNRKEDSTILLEKYNHMVDSVINIINSYETDNRIEVVFLPYKVSMWDSLESIFFAALEDPECDAHVVPIPYYEKSEEGNSLELLCDEELFLEKIPVESWKTYNIAERKPDIIFVHNPYDGNNSVTCVKPDYFSSELKKHTNMLVYVPYFLSSKEIPQSHVFLPSYRNFDKIIVQNENYKREICKLVSEDKVVVLGSPKCDHIMSEIAKFEIDELWKEKLKGKKVIFFNFSISKLLSDSIEVYMRKIEYVFDLVKKRQNIVIIWRMHPLLNSTVNSLRKELKERMLSLKEKFLKECIGIFDTSSDPATAVSVSDAYIGESSSSMMYMFGITGKPILILDDFLDEWKEEFMETDLVHLSIDDKKKNIIYFISNKHFAVCECNLITMHCRVLFCLGGLSNNYVNGAIRKFDEQIYVILNSEPVIFKYDLKTGQTSQRYLPAIGNLDDGISGFGDIVKYNGYIYILPVRYSGIICFDCDLKNMKEVIKFPQELLPTVRKSELWFYCMDCTLTSGKLYLASVFDNSIWEICLNTGQLNVHYIGEKNSRYTLGWNKELYFMERWGSGNIYLWDAHKDKPVQKANLLEEYFYLESEWREEQKDSCFFSDADKSDLLQLVSIKKNLLLSVDVRSGKIIEWGEGVLEEDIKGVFPILEDRYIINTGNKVFLYEEKKKTSSEILFKISLKELKKCREATWIKPACVYKENKCLKIEDFLDRVLGSETAECNKKENIFWKITGYNGMNIGKKCYEYIKNVYEEKV